MLLIEKQPRNHKYYSNPKGITINKNCYYIERIYKLMTIEEKIYLYKNNLDCFEEVMDKYKFLLDQGGKP